MAMIFATLTGLAFSLQAITIKFSLDVGADINQSFYDCSFCMGIAGLPFFIAEFCKETIIYSVMDLVIATGCVTLVCLGVVFLGKGLQYGKAGSVQAIENAKTIVQTLMGVIFLGQYPNVIQICGLCTGLIGVFVIILQKKDDNKSDDVEKEK
jgi:drug/metabolite transporter (DMT)-like permease